MLRAKEALYFFNCPIHGIEIQVFCFRAYDPELFGRWKRGTIKVEELSEEEKEKIKEMIDAES